MGRNEDESRCMSEEESGEESETENAGMTENVMKSESGSEKRSESEEEGKSESGDMSGYKIERYIGSKTEIDCKKEGRKSARAEVGARK